MPGSVMAIAVISSPDAMPGSQRCLLLVGAVAQEVRQADVVVQREARARRRRRRRACTSSPITRL